MGEKSMLNVLAVLESCVGDLNKVEKAVKILVFVASDDEFIQRPAVVNTEAKTFEIINALDGTSVY